MDLLTCSSNELLYASSCNLFKDSRRKDAKVVRSLSIKQPFDTEHTQNTLNEALALILDIDMSKSDYQRLRNNALSKGCNLYPAYNDVRAAKEQCLPEKTLWTVNDFSAEINFQALVDHTAIRLIQLQKQVIDSMNDLERLTLYSKVGFDGSTSQRIYNQVTVEKENRDLLEEASLLISCFVPLQLFGFINDKKIVIWSNPHPSSTLYCRPIRFSFKKETIEVLKQENQFINNSIAKLSLTFCENLTILHKIEITMVDGKVATALSTATTSSQCCSVCGCSPKKMNDLNAAKNMPLTEIGLCFGLSTLHAWIKSMECLLKISYKLTVKKWATRTISEKKIIQE
nr:uncharacterized protein LOC124809545 [Hydra vulgaris]XP_047129641.1 uncharacterized protein LOC124809545 [Hydra vulgaris]